MAKARALAWWINAMSVFNEFSLAAVFRAFSRAFPIRPGTLYHWMTILDFSIFGTHQPLGPSDCFSDAYLAMKITIFVE